MKVYCIEWKDACMLGKDQISENDSSIRLARGFSCGVVVKETKELIALAIDKFDFGEQPFRTVQTYPRSGIIKIHKMNFKCTDN